MPKILMEGPVTSLSSSAIINRKIVSELSGHGYDVYISPRFGNSFIDLSTSSDPHIQFREWIRNITDPDITIRNYWPPNFSKTSFGRLVVIQPWEFGSLPVQWVEEINRSVDEVWIPSSYVSNVYAKSGVADSKLRVIPNGFDPYVFSPRATPFPLKTQKRFRFLFVGGSVARKGIDILLEIYTSVFSDADDVCLVIKDFGADSFYRGMTYRNHIRDLMHKPASPEIEYIDEELSDAALAGLYVSCDALVIPYRGEGFGMPILESMACGTPPIVPAAGPVLDYCDSATAILVDTSEKILTEKQVYGMETAGFPSIFRVDSEDLGAKMRWAVNNRESLGAMGQRGSDAAAAGWTWKKVLQPISARVDALLGHTGGSPAIYSNIYQSSSDR